MHIDAVFRTLGTIETEILTFYEQEKIFRSTLDMIHHQVKDIRRTLANITENSYEKEIVIGSISREIEILNNLVKAITSKNNSNPRILTQEILEIVTESYSIDLFLAESDIQLSSLVVYHYKEGNELTFFLLYPALGYLNTDRIGLIAHEASHVHKIIEKYTGSIKSEKRKIGESLADILGLYVAGPLFAHSLSYIILSDIGIDHLSEIHEYHPSWMARVIVLHHVSSGLWKTTVFRRVIHHSLDSVLQAGSPLPSEDLLIAKCMREHDRYVKEFSKFKLEEKRIVSFKNEESDSLLYRLNTHYVR